MTLIVLVVIFTVTMFLWLLALLGAVPTAQYPHAATWLAFFAVLVLGVVVFLLGSGVIVWRAAP
jgi:hypothetical protein